MNFSGSVLHTVVSSALELFFDIGTFKVIKAISFLTIFTFAVPELLDLI
jgi:hypothetical protein